MIPYLPETSLAISDLTEVTHYPSKSFYLDMDNHRQTGKTVTDIEEIKQAITIICHIEKDTAPGFPAGFGIDLDFVYGMKKSFIKANLGRIIRTAVISNDDRVFDVRDFSFKDMEDDAIYCSFTVELLDDAFEMGVMINA